MNISHRSIWNSSLGAWVAVSEITRAGGKRSSGAAVALGLLGASVCSSVAAQSVFIDNGASVTVPGSQSSPWNLVVDLFIGDNGTGTLTVANGGMVSNARAFLGGFAGTGIVMVNGAGSTWASSSIAVGINLSTGNLTIANGGLVSVNNGSGRIDLTSNSPGATGVVNIGAAPASAAQAAGTVAASEVRFGTGTGSLNFNHTDTAYTFSALVTGAGVLNQYAGTTILTGANTYSGGTTISGGTLQGNTTSLQGNIANNAAVIFNQAANGTYTGAMSGGGSFTKAATGTLTLTGTNTYSGATNVNAGTLSVNGSIANSSVGVNSGGTLGGNGTLGNTLIASGGILAPGNSIGTLNVNGNLSFAAGSIYRVEVDAAGANDRINATGTATISGGTVDVQAGAGTYQASTQYTILNAAGGRTGNFAGVTSNLAFLTPTLGYNANNVFLTLARNDITFSAVAQTPNQIATSTALQNANAGATGDMGVAQTALTGLSAVQARAAYDSASGVGIVALRNAGANFAAGFGNQLQARLGAVQGGGRSGLAKSFSNRPVLLAANDHVSDLMAPVSDSPQKFSLAGGALSSSSSSSSLASSQGRGFWLRGSGGYQNTKSDGNAAASELRNSSISAGFDAELREGLVVGAALSSGTARLGFDNNTDAGKSRGSAVALYGSYATGTWAFKGSASAGKSSNHMDRAVAVGILSRTASSDFDSTTLSAYGEASYSMAMNGWTLQPLSALSLSRHKANSFTETGAGALNLQVAGQTTVSTKSLLGAKASFEAGRVRLEPRVIWAHEFGDLSTPMTAQFQGAAAASPFQVSGVALKRDTLILGLGASGSISEGMDLFADVQLEHNQRQRNLAALMGVRLRW